MVLANEFDKAGTELIFVTQSVGKTPEDTMLFGIKGLFAEYERMKILDRTHKGKLARARSGRLPGGKGVATFGYDYIPTEGLRHINPEQAHIVRQIFNWFTEEGLTISRIIARLHSLSIASPTGNKTWCAGSVHKLLTNTAYIGQQFAFRQTRNKDKQVVIRPPAEWIPIPNPAIIDEDILNKAQLY